MTDKEELEMVLRLINKHHLPLSPILEYAIRERIEAYNDYCDTNKFQVCEGLSMQNSNGLEWYVNRFSSMSVNITNNKKAPNKEILLLAIIDMIQYGNLIENRIPHNKLMSDSFAIQWQKWFPKTKTPYVWFPFYHLKSESFWHFKQYGDDNIQFKLYNLENYYQYNHFGDGCKTIVFAGAETASPESQVQNYNFAQGLQGTADTYLTVDGKRGRTYDTKVAKNSNGELKIYCEADSIQ